jgi:hypothetical protein
MIDWKEKGGEAIREVFEVCRLNLSGLQPSGLLCVGLTPVWATGDAAPQLLGGQSRASHRGVIKLGHQI